MTINELMKVAHADAKAKGFWDEERKIGEALMLIVSECGEALEAHRNGRMGDLQQFDARYPERNCELSEEASLSLFRNAFEDYIKDSFSDELADIVIRIADLCGAKEIKLKSVGLSYPEDAHANIGMALLHVSIFIGRFWEYGGSQFLDNAIRVVFGIAHNSGIDLWRYIELKLTYNRTRSYRHSKAY